MAASLAGARRPDLVGDWRLDEFADALTSSSANTVGAYCSDLYLFAEWVAALGHRLAGAMSIVCCSVDTWRRSRRASSPSAPLPARSPRFAATTRSCVTAGYLEVDPTVSLRAPAGPARLPRVLEHGEVAALARSARRDARWLRRRADVASTARRRRARGVVRQRRARRRAVRPRRRRRRSRRRGDHGLGQRRQGATGAAQCAGGRCAARLAGRSARCGRRQIRSGRCSATSAACGCRPATFGASSIDAANARRTRTRCATASRRICSMVVQTSVWYKICLVTATWPPRSATHTSASNVSEPSTRKPTPEHETRQRHRALVADAGWNHAIRSPATT